MNKLGMTALGMAAIRAAETDRTDRLFDDPYAQLFLEAMPDAFSRHATAETESLGAVFAAHGAIRTRFFDDYLLSSGCSQVVLLAAGLDTRAFRLPWPERTRLFELDLPDLLAFKDTVLAGREANCERLTLPVDLREDWPARLTACGFNPSVPTAWLAEGLLIYLTPDEAVSMFSAVSDLSAPGSKLSFEHSTNNHIATQAAAMPSMAEFTKLWKSSPDQGIPAWLGTHDWQVELHKDINYGRAGFSGEFLTAEFARSPN